jgi:NAD(P)-dependent dehydrogenase (short-subunit alcohol dehydrogenase family)
LNKSAFITGGAKRLGRQIAIFLASEGYDLAIIYNSATRDELKLTAKSLDKFPVKYKFYKCDLRKVRSIQKTVSKAGRDFRKFDVLVNNSGVIKKIEFAKITPELFDNTIAVNLRAPLFVSQYLNKYLQKSKEPQIINMASLGGLQNWSAFIPYSVSKTAVIKLTYLLARALAPKVRVNAIAPGTIVISDEKAGTPGVVAVDKIPLKKYGTPEDIIEAVRFIIKDKYLTGHVIPIDGGRLLTN